MGWETMDAGVVDLSGDSCLRQVGGHTAGQVRFQVMMPVEGMVTSTGRSTCCLCPLTDLLE